MGRPNKKGRSKGTFVMLLDSMTNSPAWLDLNGNAVKLLIHLVKMSKGNNGFGDEKRDRGELYLGDRDAARAIGVARNTARKAFAELEDHGFLCVIRKGHFDVKNQATVWRLTFQPYPRRGMAPTNEWRNWSPATSKNYRRKMSVCAGAISGF